MCLVFFQKIIRIFFRRNIGKLFVFSELVIYNDIRNFSNKYKDTFFRKN